MLTITEKAEINDLFELLKNLNKANREKASLVITTAAVCQKAYEQPEKQPA